MITTVIYLNSVFVVVVGFVYYYFKNVYSYWKKRGVVGPEPIPFFGNAKESTFRQRHVAVLYKQMYDDFKSEKMVGFYRLTLPTLLIRDLDIVKQILIKEFEAFPDRGVEFSNKGLGDNLFHCDFNMWKALKGHLTPLYTTGRLKNSVIVLNNHSDKFVDYIESICVKNPEQELIKLFQKYTIATIMANAFGISVDTIHENVEKFEKVTVSFFMQRYANELNILFPGILKKTNASLFNELVNRFCYEIVEAAKLQRRSGSTIMNNVMDILSLQLQDETKSSKRRENEQEALTLIDHIVAGQVFIFFAAGYGNNTNVLSYAMYHLAKNPKIQDNLIAEVVNVLERFNGLITYDSLKEMAYLDQIFYETLRMHPTTNSIQRCAGRDFVVPGTDIKVEKGTSIVISPLAIHHDEILYPNPEKFDPERFAPDVVKNRHSCAYLPFGAGPRACLGMRFAQLQFKVCAAKLLSKFRVEPSGRTQDEYFIDPWRSLLCPEGGIYLNIVPRAT